METNIRYITFIVLSTIKLQGRCVNIQYGQDARKLG
jgi:hypothetical protein